MQRKEYLHQYYLDHKDRMKSYIKEWRDTHPEKVLEYALKHRSIPKNKERGRLYSECRRLGNWDKYNELHRQGKEPFPLKK